MKGVHDLAQVPVYGEDVAEIEQERAADMPFQLAHGVGYPQGFFLLDVLYTQAPRRAVTEVVHYLFFQIAHDYYEIPDACRRHRFQLVLHYRFVAHRQERLWRLEAQRFYPRSKPRGKDNACYVTLFRHRISPHIGVRLPPKAGAR